jgi:hypothetical protein
VGVTPHVDDVTRLISEQFKWFLFGAIGDAPTTPARRHTSPNSQQWSSRVRFNQQTQICYLDISAKFAQLVALRPNVDYKCLL